MASSLSRHAQDSAPKIIRKLMIFEAYGVDVMKAPTYRKNSRG